MVKQLEMQYPSPNHLYFLPSGSPSVQFAFSGQVSSPQGTQCYLRNHCPPCLKSVRVGKASQAIEDLSSKDLKAWSIQKSSCCQKMCSLSKVRLLLFLVCFPWSTLCIDIVLNPGVQPPQT